MSNRRAELRLQYTRKRRPKVKKMPPAVANMDGTSAPAPMPRRKFARKQTTEELLHDTAKSINKQCELGPDYQRLFWNPKTKVAWYVSFDGDEESEIKKVRNALENVPGVEHVRVEAEYFPPDDSSGWIELYDRNDDTVHEQPWPPPKSTG